MKKQEHSKMMNLEYTTLEMQYYLKDHDITVTQAKMIFKYRTRMENWTKAGAEQCQPQGSAS